MNKKGCVVIFARYPERGKIKSRLATVYDPGFIAGLYQNFVDDLIVMLRGGDLPFFIAVHPPEKEKQMKRLFGREIASIPQEGSDLGERMKNAFIRCFSKGFESAVIIGSDIPDLPAEILKEALDALGKNDVSIGPAEDGGYYLIGFRKATFTPDVFEGISWGTDTVFKETLKALHAKNRTAHILPQWNDIDTPEDIDGFLERNERTAAPHSRTMSCLAKAAYNKGESSSLKFSIIIPVLNESETINSIIDHLEGLGGQYSFECIVVDGSDDGETIREITRKNVKTVISERGRGRQMNTGASVASGEILLFLHADTKLPESALDHIASVMKNDRYVGGAFDLEIASENPLLRLIEKAASIRSRITRIPYGDQVIFIRRAFFEELGGFKDIPIMEDVDIMQRIKKQKRLIYISRKRVRTSPRRWETEGVVYATLRNWLLMILYLLGMKSEKLVRFYK
ncbi:MAG: TIGR04283 family arsenosugar biosynthesis glycosyltransferase [Deltaproteobacteria bacterium]|nr:TIGR04283 family arsenosugar biosynthesis glycosyltransferase [Deltaproteobacteria bacterium]MBN2846639.1 TIGR04283 family arsenosugar biosynthesis glycosyltransferase [Deltaproteobacteria bacterium]